MSSGKQSYRLGNSLPGSRLCKGQNTVILNLATHLLKKLVFDEQHNTDRAVLAKLFCKLNTEIVRQRSVYNYYVKLIFKLFSLCLGNA